VVKEARNDNSEENDSVNMIDEESNGEETDTGGDSDQSGKTSEQNSSDEGHLNTDNDDALCNSSDERKQCKRALWEEAQLELREMAWDQRLARKARDKW